MIVSRKKSSPSMNLGESLQFTKNFRLTITNDLSWRQHISEITSKTKRLLGFLNRVFKEGGLTCLTRLFKSLTFVRLGSDPNLKDRSFAARMVQDK